ACSRPCTRTRRAEEGTTGAASTWCPRSYTWVGTMSQRVSPRSLSTDGPTQVSQRVSPRSLSTDGPTQVSQRVSPRSLSTDGPTQVSQRVSPRSLSTDGPTQVSQRVSPRALSTDGSTHWKARAIVGAVAQETGRQKSDLSRPPLDRQPGPSRLTSAGKRPMAMSTPRWVRRSYQLSRAFPGRDNAHEGRRYA